MKYTPVDLNRMRSALWDVMSWTHGGGYNREERERSVEAQLQTHMMNETTPEELEGEAKRLRNEWRQRSRREDEAKREREARQALAFVAVDTPSGKRWWHL